MRMIAGTFLTCVLTAATSVGHAADFRQLFDPVFVNAGPGADGFWGTGDDESFGALGVNPSGSASYFEVTDPTQFGLPAAGALFGYFVDSQFELRSRLGAQMVLGSGENEYIARDTTAYIGALEQNALSDRASLSPLFVNDGPYDITLNTAEWSPYSLFPDGTQAQDLRSLVPAFASTYDTTTLQGYYLVNGQDAASVFTGNQAVIDHFDTITPLLPADWAVVMSGRYLGTEVVTGQTSVNAWTVFSTDPTAVPADVTITGDVRQATSADAFSLRAFPDMTLIGDVFDGRVSVAAGENAVINSGYMGFDPGVIGTLEIGIGASVTIAPVAFPDDCPSGPNCIGLSNINSSDTGLFVGQEGSGGIRVYEGGTLNAGRGVVLGVDATGSGSLSVYGGTVNLQGVVKGPDGDGFNTVFGAHLPENSQAGLIVGAAGTGLLTVANGGTVNVERVHGEPLGILGVFGVNVGGDISAGGGDGAIEISGPGSTLNIVGDGGFLAIGVAGGTFGPTGSVPGTGIVDVTGGGAINFVGSGNGIAIGSYTGSSGELTVDGPGSVVNAGAGIAVGWHGFGEEGGLGVLDIGAGAEVTTDGMLGGVRIGYRGEVDVHGAGALLRVQGQDAGILIGLTDNPDPDGISSARMSLTEGAAVAVVDAGAGSFNSVGIAAFGGRGELLVDGPGTLFDTGDGLGIGANTTQFDVDPGNDIAGGEAVATVSNGATLVGTNIAVGDQGVLRGNGTIVGALYTLGGGTIAPGLSPGTLFVDGNVDMSFGGILQIEIDDLTTFDRIISSGQFVFSSLSTIEFLFADGFDPGLLTTFDLGDFLRVGSRGNDVPADSFADIIGLRAVVFTGFSNTYAIGGIGYDPVSGFNVAAAVPLPPVLWMFVGGGTAVLMAGRRRREQETVTLIREDYRPRAHDDLSS